mmetsp:Transcript_13822/g.38883  ORF Transcript_13822/g.38883 Transcript_13822/m.38883 type:complete len:182 (-) Transcript_13822:392-937(-)
MQDNTSDNNNNNTDEPMGATGEPQAEVVEVTPCGLLCACLTCLIGCACLPFVCCCAVTATGVDHAVNKAQGKRFDSVQNKWVIDDLVEEEKGLANIPDDDDDILKTSQEAADEAPSGEPMSSSSTTTTSALRREPRPLLPGTFSKCRRRRPECSRGLFLPRRDHRSPTCSGRCRIVFPGPC